MKTETEITTFKGADIFTIWEIGENGERKQFPLISFGKKKAEAILRNADELKKFCNYYTTEDIPWESKQQ